MIDQRNVALVNEQPSDGADTEFRVPDAEKFDKFLDNQTLYRETIEKPEQSSDDALNAQLIAESYNNFNQMLAALRRLDNIVETTENHDLYVAARQLEHSLVGVGLAMDRVQQILNVEPTCEQINDQILNELESGGIQITTLDELLNQIEGSGDAEIL